MRTLVLKPGEADRIVAGHPWVYEGAVKRRAAEAARPRAGGSETRGSAADPPHTASANGEQDGNTGDGELVQVKDHRGRLLGVGFYNSRSKIRVRMLASERVEVNRCFFEERIRAALAVRKRRMPGATSFRVVNAESDFVSGLIVDKYADVLAVQISSLGMEVRKALIVDALKNLLEPRAIVERSDVGSRKFEGLEPAQGLLWDSSPGGEAFGGKVVVELNGLRFECDPGGGHKTGLYLDQQANYEQVAKLAEGARVLDCFSFVGGFGLHAARAGAAQVHMLDQSEEAIEGARRHAEMNGLARKCSFEAANVFDWLKRETSAPAHEKPVPKWDMVILDPPSFTRNRASVPDALRGYKEIHLRGLKVLRPGGILATFCCSHHVDAGLFQDTVLSAAYDARRILRRVAVYGQGPDHPVIPMIPETEYLKGFAFEVV